MIFSTRNFRKNIILHFPNQWAYAGRNGILLPKLIWPTERKNCFSDWEKLLKFDADDKEFANFYILRPLEQFIWIVKLEFKLKKLIGI